MAGEELSPEAIQRGLKTKTIGKVIRYQRVVASTLDLAKEAARTGAPEGTVFLADEQTAGRGRLGRQWTAPPGGSILLSVILRPPLNLLPRINMVASLAVSLAIEEIAGLSTAIKWPNDVLIKGKKVCGVIVESEAQENLEAFAVLGVGINVNFDPSILREVIYPATTLSAELEKEVSRLTLLRALLNRLDELYQGVKKGLPIHEAWQKRLETIGKQVRVTMGQEVLEGHAEGVDGDGSLLLRLADGSLVAIVAGDVTLRRGATPKV